MVRGRVRQSRDICATRSDSVRKYRLLGWAVSNGWRKRAGLVFRKDGRDFWRREWARDGNLSRPCRLGQGCSRPRFSCAYKRKTHKVVPPSLIIGNRPSAATTHFKLVFLSALQLRRYGLSSPDTATVSPPASDFAYYTASQVPLRPMGHGRDFDLLIQRLLDSPQLFGAKPAAASAVIADELPVRT